MVWLGYKFVILVMRVRARVLERVVVVCKLELCGIHYFVSTADPFGRERGKIILNW